MNRDTSHLGQLAAGAAGLRAFRGHVPIVLVLVVGVAITIAGFVASSRHYDSEQLAQLYQEQAAPLSMVFGRSLDRYLETVYSISELYSATSKVR